MSNIEDKKEIKNNKYLYLVIGGFLGFLICIGVTKLYSKSSCVTDLKYIKPNLDCDTFDDRSQTLSVLRDKLRVLASGYKKTNSVIRMSVFVRDLNTSRFAGYNETDSYSLASLLKVPLMIGGFKLAEVEPKVLNQKIKYTGSPDLYGEQIIAPENKLVAGESYYVSDLIERAVKYSDNTAAQLLYEYYPDEFMDRIMQAIGLDMPKNGETENPVTARSFSGVFRTLYNASYLTKEYSDKSLEILTKTQFTEGALRDLPKNIVAAHKFAERTFANTGVKQFHECGIVYEGKNPYTFCIMTEGLDYNSLKDIIAETSYAIYEEMKGEEE